MNTVYLLPNEQELFAALPNSLQEGWLIEQASIGYEDSYDRMQVRCAQMTLVHPSLLQIKEKLSTGAKLSDIMAYIEDVDLRRVPEADMRELLYGLGPDLLSLIIQHQLQGATNDEDLKNVAAYSSIRHLFFAS